MGRVLLGPLRTLGTEDEELGLSATMLLPVASLAREHGAPVPHENTERELEDPSLRVTLLPPAKPQTRERRAHRSPNGTHQRCPCRESVSRLACWGRDGGRHGVGEGGDLVHRLHL